MDAGPPGSELIDKLILSHQHHVQKASFLLQLLCNKSFFLAGQLLMEIIIVYSQFIPLCYTPASW